MASSFRVSEMKYVIFVCLLLIPKACVETSNCTSSYPVASYASSSSPALQMKYHVFVSFRGRDVRQNFISHLVKAFFEKQIVFFADNKIEGGDEISQALFGAIENSLISLIIFSQDYASSPWCLMELLKVLECREKDGQLVLPVFYNVDPSDVRHQRRTYQKAFAKHKKRYDKIMVQNWKSALNESANLSGFHSSNFRNDAVLIEEIIIWVSKRLKHIHQVNSKGLVGINKRIAHLESLLCKRSEDVRIIGVWGIGGIGKTTLVEEVFYRLRFEYESCCFLAKVREVSNGHGIISLKKKLFSELLNEKDLNIETLNGLPHHVEKRLECMRILIVLDDVNDSEQLEILVGRGDWFGSGSRIIVTTRDKQVLAKEAHDIYKVEALNFKESLQLFNSNAFKQNHFGMDYYELSKKVVNYAKGIPLVLKVLAHLLHGKDKEIWESQLEKLKTMPNKKVYNVMRLSYDDLDRQEQKIFLDIACFFNRLNVHLGEIKMLLKDQDDSVAVGLERLHDKALIIISKDNIVSMHDIIQETALEIVRQKSIEDPGSNSRLWDDDDIYQALKNNKGLEAIRSISANLSVIKKLQLSPYVFVDMSKLRFLAFYSRNIEDGLHLPQGLHSLPNELRYLYWIFYPLKSLPSTFSAEKLVTLVLPWSKAEKLWDEVKNLGNLKVIDLSYSSHLMELPDFSKATNLQKMDLSFCRRMTHVHPSIFSLDKLERLDLSFSSITSLPNDIHLRSLHSLSLTGCKRLKNFPMMSESLISLNLAKTGINEFPSSIIGHLSKLEQLSLSQSDIKSLPTTMKHLIRLKDLRVRFLELGTLPELPLSIERLDASYCTSLKTVLFPSLVTEQLKENKKDIAFWNCLKLDKNSLKAIGLNAQINMMKFSSLQLSALEQNYVEDYNKDYNAKATYVYPGSKVPEWLEYRTTHDFVTIDLSSAPHSTQFAFIFCLIVPKVLSDKGLGLKFSINDGEGKGEGKSANMYLVRPKEIASDHVCLIYSQQWSRYLNKRAKFQPKFRIKVTTVSQTWNSKGMPVLLKRLGVSPINASEYDKFIHQLEWGDKAKVMLFSSTFSSSMGSYSWAMNTSYILNFSTYFNNSAYMSYGYVDE